MGAHAGRPAGPASLNHQTRFHVQPRTALGDGHAVLAGSVVERGTEGHRGPPAFESVQSRFVVRLPRGVDDPHVGELASADRLAGGVQHGHRCPPDR